MLSFLQGACFVLFMMGVEFLAFDWIAHVYTITERRTPRGWDRV
jgi:hypothetical protein